MRRRFYRRQGNRTLLARPAPETDPRPDIRADGAHGARNGGAAARLQRDRVFLWRNRAQSDGRLRIPGKLVANARICRYLERHHPEILPEFKAIDAAASLDEIGPAAAAQ